MSVDLPDPEGPITAVIFPGSMSTETPRSASTALSQARDFSTGVDYQISDKTSVGARYNNNTKLSYSQLGDVGVDVKWRLEFD